MQLDMQKEYLFTALASIDSGDIIFVGRPDDNAVLSASISTALSPSFFPVGSELIASGSSIGTVVQNGYIPGHDGLHSVDGMWVKMSGAMKDRDTAAVRVVKNSMSLAWITLSDKGARNLRVDGSGPLIEKLVRETYALSYARGFIIPDEERQLRQLLTDLALAQQFDCILTTGGTGVSPRDVTPEATLGVIEKRLKGFEQAMMAVSLDKTPHAVISRAIAGTLGNSLIVNMPGSTKAVSETLTAILPAVGHTLAKLQGDPADCGN
ncbi:MAG: MogA/MoaB family molybdenum cofactor biosynthesis protein [Desulfovibrionales bacterium]|nr:MogA/MoaB family molybdenum cofactor biosynthesis protein [Desulfovibrionales bacterium]